ncbi:MAG: transcriptional regulator [Magnetospirillum sp.]|nr:transcriptional regulator [Magnetospirillum sp.]
MVTANPIHSDEDCDAALAEIGAIMDARPGTPEGDRLEVLSTLVQAWEARHHPIELIRFAVEARGLKMADLEPMIGGSGRVSEVMNRRRALTLAMILRLHDGLGLPAEVLVREYPLAARVA